MQQNGTALLAVSTPISQHVCCKHQEVPTVTTCVELHHFLIITVIKTIDLFDCFTAGLIMACTVCPPAQSRSDWNLVSHMHGAHNAVGKIGLHPRGLSMLYVESGYCVYLMVRVSLTSPRPASPWHQSAWSLKDAHYCTCPSMDTTSTLNGSHMKTMPCTNKQTG